MTEFKTVEELDQYVDGMAESLPLGATPDLCGTWQRIRPVVSAVVRFFVPEKYRPFCEQLIVLVDSLCPPHDTASGIYVSTREVSRQEWDETFPGR